ncbi:hypothetical protein V3331_16330 [Gaopeijia maritima]|uniref:hypothetical protein n=1 Tax=Gaopeijia maritima TaxID=3119007 RepID=UPI003251EF71
MPFALRTLIAEDKNTPTTAKPVQASRRMYRHERKRLVQLLKQGVAVMLRKNNPHLNAAQSGALPGPED